MCLDDSKNKNNKTASRQFSPLSFFFFFLLKKDNDGSQEKDIFKNKWQRAAQILTCESQKNQKELDENAGTTLDGSWQETCLTLRPFVKDYATISCPLTFRPIGTFFFWEAQKYEMQRKE